jgi:nickel-dependent lactate racemase
MAGHNAAPLTENQIRSKLAEPIGSAPLRQLAKGKRECAILIDDLTRPTKASQVVPSIIDELHEGGMKDKHIRFVMAPGAHHWMRLDDLKRKLGEDIPDHFNIYNHNVYDNNAFVGTTSYGTRVYINREVMGCDLKIGVGCIIPHRLFGFGGGAKIVVPGVASIETIHQNHSLAIKGETVRQVERNIKRLDAEEAAAMIGLNFIVNVLITPKRDCSELVCGDAVAAHREGVRFAESHYATETSDADLVVVNGYPMESEAYKIFDMAKSSLKGKGDVVVLVHTPEGLRGHYYNGRFGSDYGGKGWKPAKYFPESGKIENLFVVAPHRSLADYQYFGLASRWFNSWSEVLGELRKKYEKSRVRAAVYPYAPIQVPK